MRLPKWAVPVAGALIVAGALASREFYQVKEREKVRAEAVASEQAAVKITASLVGCLPPGPPLRITVRNASQRRLKAVTFHMGIYEAGRVGDRDGASPDQHWTLALAPGAEESRCSEVSVQVGPETIFKAEKRGLHDAVFEDGGQATR